MDDKEVFEGVILAALSLWEGADGPETNPEYLRGQAETLARFMQARGWDIPTSGVQPGLSAAAAAVGGGACTTVQAAALVARLVTR